MTLLPWGNFYINSTHTLVGSNLTLRCNQQFKWINFHISFSNELWERTIMILLVLLHICSKMHALCADRRDFLFQLPKFCFREAKILRFAVGSIIIILGSPAERNQESTELLTPLMRFEDRWQPLHECLQAMQCKSLGFIVEWLHQDTTF